MNLIINSMLPVDNVEISVRHATPNASPITACEPHSPNSILGKFSLIIIYYVVLSLLQIITET